MSFTFTFNNVSSADMGLSVNRVKKPMLPQVSRESMRVAGMPGSYLMQTNLLDRVIGFDVFYDGDTYSEASARANVLASWLYTLEPVLLTQSDESDRTYYAVLDGSTDLEELILTRRGTLRFLCTDPYAYAATPVVTAIAAVGDTSVSNEGGVDTFPTVGLTLDGPTTFLEVLCAETGEYVRFGTPANVDTTPTDPTTLDFNDDCSEMDWTPAEVTRDGDANLPTDPTNPMVMVTNLAADAFSPGSAGGNYGTGAAWHGPTVLRTLSTAADDFRITARLKLLETAPTVGRAEILLLDASNNILGFAGVFDAWGSLAEVHWRGSTGIMEPVSRRILTPTATGDGGDYEYEITLQRVGNTWTATHTLIWYKQVGTELWNREWRTWVDDGTYGANVAKVGIHIATRAASTPPTMHCSNVTVYHLNAVTSADTPIVAYAGDVVGFDMRQGRVTVNGSDLSIVPDVDGTPLSTSALVDLESTYFALPVGDSTLRVSTDGGVGVTGTVTHQERWL